jgi:apolipoprotein N-acyltransferase
MEFVPFNDSDFASTEKTFHFADVAFRAVASQANFVLASVDGPTAFIDKYGRVVVELPYGTAGVLRAL